MVTVEIDGPAIVQVEARIVTPPGPVRVQVGAPVGATDPVVPVMCPVKIMTWPLEPVD